MNTETQERPIALDEGQLRMLKVAESYLTLPEVQARLHEFDLEQASELKRM
jgi:hypothetical protein